MTSSIDFTRWTAGFAAVITLAVSPCSAVAQSATVYSYDALGRLTAVRDGTGYTTDHAFDKASNRTNVKVVEQLPTSWAASALPHIVGYADAGGWAASTTSPQGHIVYGPYTTAVTAGPHVAAYRMLVDNNTADNANVVIIDVYDSNLSIALASRTITRREWNTAFGYEVFELPFSLASGSVGHAIEFRVYYLQTSYVRVERVGYR